jgi:TPR repeat protein
MTPGEVQEFEVYKDKAESGSAFIQYKLAVCYANGEGVASDDKTAAYWYRKSAEQGYGMAQEALGDCYAFGIGIEADDSRAFRWYRRSAEQGFAPAQLKVGRFYEHGKGAVRDAEKATDWYREAAAQHHTQACAELGRCYAKGIGVHKNKPEGYAYLCLSSGMSEARKELASLRTQMSADDISEGVKRLKEFILEGLIVAAPKFRTSIGGSAMDTRMTEQFSINWAKSRLEDTFIQMRKWDIDRCLASAKMGDVSAQAYLGMSYAVGDGVKPDPVRGYAYLSASGVDDVSVRTAIADLAKKMTPEDLSAARDLAAEVKKAGK